MKGMERPFYMATQEDGEREHIEIELHLNCPFFAQQGQGSWG